MTINTSLFTAQSGDYSVITQAITANDALVFGAIYEALSDHASVSRKINPENLGIDDYYTILDYVQAGIAVNLTEESLDVASLATLKAVGLISTNDGVHICLTLLGLGFYDFIQI